MRVESGLIRTISSMVLHVLCIILGLKGAKFLYIVQVEFWVEPHSKAQGYIQKKRNREAIGRKFIDVATLA